VVVLGDDLLAKQLQSAAVSPFALNKSVLLFEPNRAVAENLPPALAQTIPHLPGIQEGKSAAVICSNFACQPPVSIPADLVQGLGGKRKIA